MTALTPTVAAHIAGGVYKVQTVALADDAGVVFGCGGQFRPIFNSCMLGSSGCRLIDWVGEFGFVAEGEGTRRGELLIATRGTDGAMDWVLDSRAGLAAGPNGSFVHVGFLQLWQSTLLRLETVLHGRRPTHVHCVGHSLGGALATLNASYVAGRFGCGVSLYTFGSPRVGGLQFAERLTAQLGARNIYRVNHASDVVPWLPAFPYCHVPTSAKSYTLHLTRLPVSFLAHKMKSYSAAVDGRSWGELAAISRPCVSEFHARDAIEALRVAGVKRFCSTGLALISRALASLLQRAARGGLNCLSECWSMHHTALDDLAQLLVHPRSLVDIGPGLKIVIRSIFAFLGHQAPSEFDLCHEFVRWVFCLLNDALKMIGRQALRMAHECALGMRGAMAA